MKEKDFFDKYNLFKHENENKNDTILYEALDILYCGFTYSQAIQMVKDYYENADDIFNSKIVDE